MKKIIILSLLLIIIFMGSADAMSITFSCDALGNVVHCEASSIDVLEYQWEWKHVDDTHFSSTGWIPVEYGNTMDFVNTYKGRHIICLTGRNGSATVSCQKGVTLHHGQHLEPTMTTTTITEEEGEVASPSSGEKIVDWFSNLTVKDIMLISIICIGSIVFLMMFKKKRKEK